MGILLIVSLNVDIIFFSNILKLIPFITTQTNMNNTGHSSEKSLKTPVLEDINVLFLYHERSKATWAPTAGVTTHQAQRCLNTSLACATVGAVPSAV
jgi:hypothetical protein